MSDEGETDAKEARLLKHREYSRKSRAKNKEKVNQRNRDYNAANRTARAQNRKKYKYDKPDIVRAARKRYYEKHKDRLDAQILLLHQKQRATLKEIRDRRQELIDEEPYLPPRSVKALLLREPLYAAADTAVPKGIPDAIRDDMIADICLAVCLREFKIEDIPARAKAIMAANNKMFSKYGPESLDTNSFDADGPSLHDKLSVGLWGEQDDEDSDDEE